MKVEVFGIPNCDTVKKALNYLKESGVDFEFINFKKNPPSSSLIKEARQFMDDWPVNKRGTTYRKLKDEYEAAADAQKLKIIAENSSMLKRPILKIDGSIEAIGFDAEKYSKMFP